MPENAGLPVMDSWAEVELGLDDGAGDWLVLPVWGEATFVTIECVFPPNIESSSGFWPLDKVKISFDPG